MLDTNICIYLIKEKSDDLIAQLKRAMRQGVAVSSMTLCELEFGVRKSLHVGRNTMNLMKFLLPFEILAFDAAAAREYGRIRADLQKAGTITGNMDMLIGAHARSCGVRLVTNNEGEFDRIEGLRVENWTKSP